LAHQTNEPVYFAADKAQPHGYSDAITVESEASDEKQAEGALIDDGSKHDQVYGDVSGQEHIETVQPNVVVINDQTLLLLVESRVEQSRELVPNASTLSVPTTTTIIADTVQNDALVERQTVDDQGEDGNAPCERDTIPSDAIASTPCGESAEPSHEVEATILNALDIKPTDEPIPSGDELRSEINTDAVFTEDDVDHTWVADDGETATTVILPDPPSTDPTLSRSETIALAKLDTKPSYSEVTPETLYIALLSPEEAHEQRVSYLVGELPKVAVIVPPTGPQTTNQELETQEQKEAEQAAKKIEAERDELERSTTCHVEPNTVEEAKTAPVAFEDGFTWLAESVAEGQC
jgi:hypothetical protein